MCWGIEAWKLCIVLWKFGRQLRINCLIKCIHTLLYIKMKETWFFFFVVLPWVLIYQMISREAFSSPSSIFYMLYIHQYYSAAIEYYCWLYEWEEKNQQMAALNWMQQQFSETVPVTGSCSVKYLKNFHFQDCFGCWNIVAEWDAWINYHTYNFLI